AQVRSAQGYFLQGELDEAQVLRVAAHLLTDPIVEFARVARGTSQLMGTGESSARPADVGWILLKPGVMDPVAESALPAVGELGREPTHAERETLAQTWGEHGSHKTLKGRIRYRDERGERQFDNMLKETIFAATQQIRRDLGADDWCVSVFEDNAGIVRFDDQYHVCFKVETHNHPSAIEPYGGANTGLGGVIRDPLGTGLRAKPSCTTDLFCFAPPQTPAQR